MLGMGRVEVFGALAEVPAPRWDAAVSPGRGGLGHAFLAPCERVLDRGTWRVFTFTQPRAYGFCAVSPGVIHSVDLAGWLPAAARWVAAAVRRLRPGALRPRVLELGPPGWPGPPISGQDPLALEDAAAPILEAAWQQVAGEGQADALLVRDFAGPGFTPLEQRLRALGFALVAERPTFVANVQVPTLQAYLASMRADYRRRAQRYLEVDLRVSITADFAGRAEEIARLCALTTDRARESRRERVDAAVVRGWARCPQARAVLLSDPEGRLELAALVLEDPPVLHFIRVGFDDRAGRQTGAYPRLLYELCRMAIERGLSFVDFGLTSADPKLRAGAQPIPLRVWARHRHPGVQALLRAALPLLRDAHRPPVRHVFREPPPPIDPHWYGEG
jgi:Acetyltransferase (GNAT) domain